ncbi:MGMT family protein [Candidatus Dojkabacteria bacterium]|uniref:MGMT family protein n=1 Tax=Candidatus Dojkabacteria bacterium TaxID=2099670 RepID=A0A955LA06_9BACT|nr:MGMT family protein [Candidatus Dojkabacteria bacterium]
MKNYKEVFEYIKNVPPGSVVTYKQVAIACGLNTPRLVGKILHRNENPEIYPCHRVVRANGTVASGYAFGGPGKQQKMLENEGVKFENGKIDLSIFQY